MLTGNSSFSFSTTVSEKRPLGFQRSQHTHTRIYARTHTEFHTDIYTFNQIPSRYQVLNEFTISNLYSLNYTEDRSKEVWTADWLIGYSGSWYYSWNWGLKSIIHLWCQTVLCIQCDLRQTPRWQNTKKQATRMRLRPLRHRNNALELQTE